MVTESIGNAGFPPAVEQDNLIASILLMGVLAGILLVLPCDNVWYPKYNLDRRKGPICTCFTAGLIWMNALIQKNANFEGFFAQSYHALTRALGSLVTGVLSAFGNLETITRTEEAVLSTSAFIREIAIPRCLTFGTTWTSLPR